MLLSKWEKIKKLQNSRLVHCLVVYGLTIWCGCFATKVAATIWRIRRMLKGLGHMRWAWLMMKPRGYSLYHKGLGSWGRNKGGVDFIILIKPLRFNIKIFTTNSTMNCPSPFQYIVLTLTNSSLNQNEVIESHWQTNIGIIWGPLTMDYIWWTFLAEWLADSTKSTINILLSISAVSLSLPLSILVDHLYHPDVFIMLSSHSLITHLSSNPNVISHN